MTATSELATVLLPDMDRPEPTLNFHSSGNSVHAEHSAPLAPEGDARARRARQEIGALSKWIGERATKRGRKGNQTCSGGRGGGGGGEWEREALFLPCGGAVSWLRTRTRDEAREAAYGFYSVGATWAGPTSNPMATLNYYFCSAQKNIIIFVCFI